MEGHTKEGQGVRRGTDKMVRFDTVNIQNGRNRGLELALCRMGQGRMDCDVLQEKNSPTESICRKPATFR